MIGHGHRHGINIGVVKVPKAILEKLEPMIFILVTGHVCMTMCYKLYST